MWGLYRNLKLGLHTSTWAYTSFGPHGPHIISPTGLLQVGHSFNFHPLFFWNQTPSFTVSHNYNFTSYVVDYSLL